MDIDRIIDIVRTLKEEGGPTMAMGHGQIAGSAEAGDEPPVRKKKKKYIYGGKNSRKMWLQK
tara:strand:- start:432 stop:617 length:186 start_codon:yes stop_codon:yes gene_type:complete